MSSETDDEQYREAVAALDSGDAERAERIARDLARRRPKVAKHAHILAKAMRALGRTKKDVGREFEKAMRLGSRDAGIHADYAGFLIEIGKLGNALESLKKALKMAPGHPAALSMVQAHKGMATLQGGGAISEAARMLREALRIDSKNCIALLELARILSSEKQNDLALGLLGRALKAGANQAKARLCIAHALDGLGREDEALTEIARVLESGSARGPAHSLRATIHQTRGRFKEAAADFREAFEAMPRNGETYRLALATYRLALGAEKLDPDDPLIAKMEKLWKDESLRDSDRRSLGFALAMAMEDSDRHDRVFDYLRPANELMRKAFPYDDAHGRSLPGKVRNRYGQSSFRTDSNQSDSGFAPIFVTGLPRSGTTLVEHILASHSRVVAGGELGYATAEIERALAGAGQGWDAVSVEERRATAKRIKERMRRAADGAAVRITDKSVNTWFAIGPILEMFPEARVIALRRDPLDNLYSIYRNKFGDGTHRFAYDLGDLGRHYHAFEEILAFWREKCPNPDGTGGFREIQYEKLVADPEAEIRAFLAACGLDWEESCLKFHENPRKVDTIRPGGVRKRLNSSSVGIWKRHEKELGELIETLKDDGSP